MKNNVIAFGLTADRVMGAACVVMDIAKYCSNYVDEVIIFHDNISKKDQQLIQSIFPTKFIVYQFPSKIKYILQSETLQRFTYMVFAKFESLRLLNEYKKVLWLDDDIVIMSNISELFNDCESGIRFVYTGAKVEVQFHKPIAEYNMEAQASGAMPFIVQDNLYKYQEMYEYCYEKLEQYAKYVYLPEQAIFDLMIQDFHLTYEPFDNEIYCADAKSFNLDPKVKILHSFGFPKFWNGLKNEHWNANYQAWIKMGGSKYKKKSFLYKIKIKLNNIINRAK